MTIADRRSESDRYRLREVSDDDLEFMFEVKRSGMREYFEATWGAWDDDAQRKRFFDLFTPAYDRIVVTEAGEVGTLTMVWDCEPPTLVGIYLAVSARGAGLGTEIIRDILDRARQLGRSIQLRVWRSNSAARRLYERLGFVVVEESETHLLMQWAP